MLQRRKQNSGASWTVTARANNSADILIYGEISDSAKGRDDLTAQRFESELRALGDVAEIHIRINSFGGSVWGMMAIYNMLKRHPARKIVHVDGLAASAATVIMMAGDEIVMPDNAMLMIHNPSSEIFGDCEKMQTAAQRLKDAQSNMADIYAARTGQPRDKIIEMMNAETWMNAEKALELGFCDRVEAGMQIAAIQVGGVRHDLSGVHPPEELITKLKGAKEMDRIQEPARMRGEVVEGTTNISATCPNCGATVVVLVEPAVIGDGVEIPVSEPLNTPADVEEMAARGSATGVRAALSASVTCPNCGCAFEATVEDDPGTSEPEVSADPIAEEVVQLIEELINEELPGDPIQAKAYMRGLVAGMKARADKRGMVTNTARAAAVFAARQRDARASGAYAVAGGATGVARQDKGAMEARRREAAAEIAKYANERRGGKRQ